MKTKVATRKVFYESERGKVLWSYAQLLTK